MNAVHVLVPDGIDEPTRPSGGNVYDRRICQGLAADGWSVHEHPVPGSWPRPDRAARAALSEVVAKIPDGAVVLLDGLVASTSPETLVPEARRLRLVVLVHMPLGVEPADDGAAAARERAVLSAAAAVVATSPWTRRRLLDRHALRPSRVHVAEPGVDPAGLVPGTASGGELLCVAAVTQDKGHEVLLPALALLRDRPWRCVLVGTLDREPDLVVRLRRRTRDDGIAERVCFAGPRTGSDLDAAYASADVLVLPSRAETFGMVVTEALVRGLPVIATAVGGLPETLGRAAGGGRPGLLVPPDQPGALAEALSGWLDDADLRQRLRRAARARRAALPGWQTTTARLSTVLTEVMT